MKKILVPVDFSTHTEVTCRYAVAIASATGAEILLFHTYFDQMIVAGGTYPDSLAAQAAIDVQMIAEIKSGAEDEMAALAQTVGQLIDPASGVRLSTRVEGGDAASGIVELCSDWHPELIIIGAQGRGEKDPFTGSTAAVIMRHALVPVLAIPEKAGFNGFGQIMYAASLIDGNEVDIRFIFDLFASFSPVVHCVHLHCSDEKYDDVKLSRLKHFFEKETAEGKIGFRLLECQNHRQGLTAYLENRKIEMIAFKLHHPSLFEFLFRSRLSRKDLFRTGLPLLAFPGE